VNGEHGRLGSRRLGTGRVAALEAGLRAAVPARSASTSRLARGLARPRTGGNGVPR